MAFLKTNLVLNSMAAIYRVMKLPLILIIKIIRLFKSIDNYCVIELFFAFSIWLAWLSLVSFISLISYICQRRNILPDECLCISK